MKSYKQWREASNVGEPEQPTPDDYHFYNTKLAGNMKRYLDRLVMELEKTHGKMSLVRKGFIIQEVMDALELDAGQVSRLSNNIKRGMAQAQAAQAKATVPGTPATY